MRQTLRFIGEYKPQAVLLENVLGIADIPRGADSSALQLILDTLDHHGYDTSHWEVDLARWATIARPRTARANHDSS